MPSTLRKYTSQHATRVGPISGAAAAALMRTVRNKRKERRRRRRRAEERGREGIRGTFIMILRGHLYPRACPGFGFVCPNPSRRLPACRFPFATSSFPTGFLLISPQRCLACLCFGLSLSLSICLSLSLSHARLLLLSLSFSCRSRMNERANERARFLSLSFFLSPFAACRGPALIGE